MKTFVNLLKYYNNLDIEPFIEAADKIREFYIPHAIDTCKDCVSLPGVIV